MARFLVVLVVLMVPLTALASGVYLNGVRIDGVRDMVLEDATVRIDSEGNIHIDAPKYRVASASGASAPVIAERQPATPAESAQLTRRYLLITRQSEPGATQYDIDVYVNSRFIRKLHNAEGQVVTDITEHLRPGRNRVMLMARKNLESGRRSRSADHTFRVIIGEGDTGGNRVVIDRPLIDFQRSAADVDDVTREFDLDAR